MPVCYLCNDDHECIHIIILRDLCIIGMYCSLLLLNSLCTWFLKKQNLRNIVQDLVITNSDLLSRLKMKERELSSAQLQLGVKVSTQ